MNSNRYQEVLINHLVDIGNSVGGFFKKIMLLFIGQKLILPDSNPKNSMFLPRPSLTADLNPIENVQRLLASKVDSKEMQFRTKEQFKNAILNAWKEISINQPRNLVNSMTERIFEVI